MLLTEQLRVVQMLLIEQLGVVQMLLTEQLGVVQMLLTERLGVVQMLLTVCKILTFCNTKHPRTKSNAALPYETMNHDQGMTNVHYCLLASVLMHIPLNYALHIQNVITITTQLWL
jgi:hypothetical protein